MVFRDSCYLVVCSLNWQTLGKTKSMILSLGSKDNIGEDSFTQYAFTKTIIPDP